ncbi:MULTISPECIES: gamma-glutamyl-gamma-aminobutyrate hydrolase family protein [Nonomuraea]|uniref:Gamma-glutamyl-gamma-aminobutyrate hydrolase family protein n=1 Tax=Nonomuraea mangrovi TaxID=2316207 RepID=A0ABW4T2K8_9ACTN
MTRPLIGITCYVEPAQFTVWEMTTALLPYMYVEQVVRAGGQPVILPPAGDPASIVSRLDGVILAGGGDIDPTRYAETPHERTGFVRTFRDSAEFSLADTALKAGLPFLGICRGLQVLNITLGGSLHQHLPDVVGHSGHAPAPGEFGHMPVSVTPGSRLAGIVGEETVTVPHYHHQSIRRLGTGLHATAHAADGAIEAAELPGHRFVLGVQWHPEAGEDGSLFRALVEAAE